MVSYPILIALFLSIPFTFLPNSTLNISRPFANSMTFSPPKTTPETVLQLTFLTFFLPVATPSPLPAALPEGPEDPRTYLKQCLETQKALDRVKMKVVTDDKVTQSVNDDKGASRRDHARDTLLFQRDGIRLDIQGKRERFDNPKLTRQYRIITNQDYAPPM